MKKKESAPKKKSAPKKDVSSAKIKTFWSVILIVCLALTARVITRSIISISEYQGRVRTQKYIDEKMDTAMSELNNKLNKFETAEQVSDYFKNHAKDGEKKDIGVILGFLHQKDAIREFCEPTGYVPEKYINAVKHYQSNTDYNEEFVEILMKDGLNRELSTHIQKKLYTILAEQSLRFLEADYKKLLEIDASASKRDFCKIYDEYADEIITEKLKEIRENAPNAYKKYFLK